MNNGNAKENEATNNIIDLYNYSNINKGIYKKLKQAKNEKYYYIKDNKTTLIKNIKNIYKNIIFKFLLYIYILQFLPICLSEKKRKISSNYKISISALIGYQNILNAAAPIPSRVLIDGCDKEVSQNSYYNITSKESIITFIWDELPQCSGLFQSSLGLLSIDLSNFDFSEITDMSFMFHGCISLKSIKFGDNFITSNVQKMDYMFYNCYNLVSLDLKSFDTGNVVNMNSMFYNAKALISLNLFSFDTKKVTNMKYMFYGCTSLIYINLIKFNDMQASVDNIFSNKLNNLIYCINTTTSPNIFEFLQNYQI